MKRIIAMAACFLAVFGLSGCNGYATAEKITHVISVIVTLAEGDLPAFQQTGAFTQQEAAGAQSYLAVVNTLNNQYGSCIDAAQNAKLKTNGKFVACLNIFLAGVTDPKELAMFRVFNPKAQQHVQLWVAAIQLGVNTALAALGGQAQPVAQIVSVPSAETKQFEERVRRGL